MGFITIAEALKLIAEAQSRTASTLVLSPLPSLPALAVPAPPVLDDTVVVLPDEEVEALEVEALEAAAGAAAADAADAAEQAAQFLFALPLPPPAAE